MEVVNTTQTTLSIEYDTTTEVNIAVGGFLAFVMLVLLFHWYLKRGHSRQFDEIGQMYRMEWNREAEESQIHQLNPSNGNPQPNTVE